MINMSALYTGDHEGSDLVGVIEAFIGAQGSPEGVEAAGHPKSPHTPASISSSPLQYPPVFVTPVHESQPPAHHPTHNHWFDQHQRRNLSDSQLLGHHGPQQPNLENQLRIKSTPELIAEEADRRGGNTRHSPREEEQQQEGNRCHQQQQRPSHTTSLLDLPSPRAGFRQSMLGTVSPAGATLGHLQHQGQPNDESHNDCHR